MLLVGASFKCVLNCRLGCYLFTFCVFCKQLCAIQIGRHCPDEQQGAHVRVTCVNVSWPHIIDPFFVVSLVETYKLIFNNMVCTAAETRAHYFHFSFNAVTNVNRFTCCRQYTKFRLFRTFTCISLSRALASALNELWRSWTKRNTQMKWSNARYEMENIVVIVTLSSLWKYSFERFYFVDIVTFVINGGVEFLCQFHSFLKSQALCVYIGSIYVESGLKMI